MKYLLLFSVILFSISSSAQDCTKELLKQKPGKWKAGQQGSIVNVKAADLTKEKLVIAGIHKMVSANYKPTGCEISYGTVYGKYPGAGQTWIADPYHYVMRILRSLTTGKSCLCHRHNFLRLYIKYHTATLCLKKILKQ